MSRGFISVRVLLLCGLVQAQENLLPGSCSFELDSCGYTSDPETRSWSMNEEGHLISVDSELHQDHDPAVLVSPVLDYREWSCVRLVYQITGRGSLQIHLRPDSDNFDYLLWSSSRASDSWLISSLDMPNGTKPVQILLTGRPEQGSGNSVAIFEIHIVPGYCLECNFEEHHLCGYSNSWNPNVNWYVGGSLTRDREDNTTTNRGHFMYVDSVYAKHFQEVAKLSSPMTTVPMSGCLSFFYHRDQETGNIFSVFTRDHQGHYEDIWKPDVYFTAGWTYVSVDIKAPKPLELVFEAAFNSAKGGYVAIDDITFSPEFCHTDTEPTFDPSMADCDFDSGMCLYYQERVDSSGWRRAALKANLYRTGDHTTGTGSFLLTNAPFTLRTGYVGRLHGPLLPGNHRYCVKFFYLLQGFRSVDNALLLYIYDENNVAQEKVWSLTESPRGVWTQVEITYLKPMASKLVFVSICKNMWECGLVAIDDITVRLGNCQVHTAPLPTHCDFEGGVCGFIQERTKDKADWLRVRGHTPTSYTGPRGDHTTGLGYFMYIEASLMRPGHKARLSTSDLRGSSSPQCLVFFFHMYGSGTGILSVLLRDAGTETLLWRRRGEQSISWIRAKVDYTCADRHQIIFEAIRGPSLRSDIALDDISFQRGPCTDLTDVAPFSGSSEDFNQIEK
ncbi:MAM domain-containing protein 2a [Halichoeres trimaculatus]|uniref:MAM domain-containing protein 2a n=1 Tax=Halichoeres trimaculatus TaxID=147232 RepID=UPI003D9DF8B7